MTPENACVRPNGEWCLLDELKDYQDDGRFLEGDHEIMSYECMLNRIAAALAGEDGKG